MTTHKALARMPANEKLFEHAMAPEQARTAPGNGPDFFLDAFAQRGNHLFISTRFCLPPLRYQIPYMRRNSFLSTTFFHAATLLCNFGHGFFDYYNSLLDQLASFLFFWVQSQKRLEHLLI